MYNDVCNAECGLKLRNKFYAYLLTYLLKAEECIKFVNIQNVD